MRLIIKYLIVLTVLMVSTANAGEDKAKIMAVMSIITSYYLTTEDTTAPIINLNNNSTVFLNLNDTYTETVTAIDAVDGKIEVIVEGNVDTSVAGRYILKYKATDRSGNASTAKRIVYVGDRSGNTILEDASDGNTEGWAIFTQGSPTIENIYDSDKASQVIRITTEGTSTGYRLGHSTNKEGSWKNTTDKIISWNIKTNNNFSIHITTNTTEGIRTFKYSPDDKDPSRDGDDISLGIGSHTNDGTWQTIVRDLEVDLKKLEPENNITEVNGMFVRGSMLLDDIKLRIESISFSIETKYERTAKDSVNIFIKGKLNSEIFINNISTNIRIGKDGRANITLNTSGDNGSKIFNIYLKNNEIISLTHKLTINKDTTKNSEVINGFKINGIITDVTAKLITVNHAINNSKNSGEHGEFEKFENVYIFEKFRVFYRTNGDFSIINKNDENNNLIPDLIEDIMTEAVVTKSIMDENNLELFGSLHNDVGIEYIDIFVTNSKKNDSSKYSGSYYKGYNPSLVYEIFNINNMMQKKSALIRIDEHTRRLQKSVPHELFHAYQYSNTMLLNSWFIEGSAEWFEYALAAGTGKSNIELPKDIETFRKNILFETYRSRNFWNRITNICTDFPTFSYPQNINPKKKYLLNNNVNILSDNKLNGLGFMRVFIENLNTMNDVVLKEYDPLIKSNKINNLWDYKIRKSKSNESYIIKSIIKTIETTCNHNNELDLFKTNVLDNNFSNLIFRTEEYTDYASNNNSLKYWKVEDKEPSGAKVISTYDHDKDHNVTELLGDSIYNGYRFLKNSIYDNRNKEIKFDIKNSDLFYLYIKVITKDGNRSIVYNNHRDDAGDYYKYIDLSDRIHTGYWNTIVRNLNIDLKKSEPDNEVISIIDIYARGNFRIDNIHLFTSSLINPLPFKYNCSSSNGNKNIYSRNVWDMKLFKNKIYIGTGNSRCNAGPVPIVSIDLNNDTLNFEKQISHIIVDKNGELQEESGYEQAFIREEKINNFLFINDELMIAGDDPTQKWTYGNYYKKHENGWKQYRILDNVIHSHDIETFDNKIFIAGSSCINKISDSYCIPGQDENSFRESISRSEDNGKTWTYQHLRISNRIYNLLKVGGHFFATTRFLANKNTIYSYKYNISEGRFEEKKHLNKSFFFPDTKLDNKTCFISKDIQITDNITLYIGSFLIHDFSSFGLYMLKNNNNEVNTVKIDIDEYRILDFVKFGNNTYLLLDDYNKESKTYNVKVAVAYNNDFSNLIDVVEFKSRNIITSFEVTNNFFYFSTGIEKMGGIKEYLLYENSLIEDVGKILKIYR